IVIITEDGKETLIEADTIISSYRVANSSLLDVLEFAVDEIYCIGDAVRPRGLYQAIQEGYRLGLDL
ncbi:MAG: hypothetical protein GX989_08180, partial [Firmicutes bacterium]|nr:hypothetical protein [Bacillota bacterium]